MNDRWKKAWREKVADRVFTIHGTLQQLNAKGSDYFAFRDELEQLLRKHGITKYPDLTITVTRQNGKLTDIAKP